MPPPGPFPAEGDGPRRELRRHTERFQPCRPPAPRPRGMGLRDVGRSRGSGGVCRKRHGQGRLPGLRRALGTGGLTKPLGWALWVEGCVPSFQCHVQSVAAFCGARTACIASVCTSPVSCTKALTPFPGVRCSLALRAV